MNMKGIFLIAIVASVFCCSLIFLMVYTDEYQQRRLQESLQTPRSVKVEDVIGVWEHQVSCGRELLILKEDLTFNQILKSRKNNFYTTGRWWIETVKKGGFRLHLEGARFYSWGIEFAMREGMYPADGGLPERPIGFWDPFVEETVYMPHKLVLQVRILPSGELVLHSLLPPHEIMKLGDIYRKIETP